MSAIWRHQTDLAQALTSTGLPTEPALPERATAPFRYLRFTGLSTGQAFGSWTAEFQVMCVAKHGPNAVEEEEVVGMAVAVVLAAPGLDGFALAADAVAEPGDFMLNGQPHLAVPVTITARISRADMEV